MKNQDNRLATNARMVDPRLFLRDEELDRALDMLLNASFVLTEYSILAQTECGLDRNSLRLLLLLRSTPSLGISKARTILGFTVPTFARLIASLEQRKLISKGIGKKDSRERVLSLTDKGQDSIAPATKAMRNTIKKAWRMVGPEKVAGTMAALKAIQR